MAPLLEPAVTPNKKKSAHCHRLEITLSYHNHFISAFCFQDSKKGCLRPLRYAGDPLLPHCFEISLVSLHNVRFFSKKGSAAMPNNLLRCMSLHVILGPPARRSAPKFSLLSDIRASRTSHICTVIYDIFHIAHDPREF